MICHCLVVSCMLVTHFHFFLDFSANQLVFPEPPSFSFCICISISLFITCINRLSYQVRYLTPIQHRNLVTLLGYCQENNLQFLIYEYIPNGSVSSHLYGNSLLSLKFTDDIQTNSFRL